MDKVFFKSKGVKLCGIFLLPKEKCPIVIFSHGYGSGKDSSRNRAIADELVKRGIGAFLIDFSGHGESEGIIAEDVVSQQVEDLKAAIDVAAEKTDKIGINGSSLGGSVALYAVDKRIKAIVLRAPPSEGLEKIADTIEIPVLVIQGENDPLLAQNKELVKHFKNGKLEVIKQASHLFEEHLEVMVQKTVEFFEQVLL